MQSSAWCARRRTAILAASIPLAFAGRHGLSEQRVISAFLHAARLGLFELSWNVLCPHCSGVLDANASLKSVRSQDYCAFCAAGCVPTLDENVEVTFTVTPRVRHIAAHAPTELPFAEYMREIFFSSGVDLPDDYTQRMDRINARCGRAAGRREGAGLAASFRPDRSSCSIR